MTILVDCHSFWCTPSYWLDRMRCLHGETPCTTSVSPFLHTKAVFTHYHCFATIKFPGCCFVPTAYVVPVRGPACLRLRRIQRAHTKNMFQILYDGRLIEIEGGFNLYQSGKIICSCFKPLSLKQCRHLSSESSTAVYRYRQRDWPT